MFNLWSKELPDTIEVVGVQLPGRESRHAEPCIRAMPELVAKLVDGLGGVMDGPYAFYGHSIGALIAFELTRELRRQGKPAPLHLLVSGRRAPQSPPLPPTYHLNDQDFLADLTTRYGAMPAAVLDDPEVLAIFLSIVRADVELMDTYRFTEEPPLATPIAAYGGTQDRTLTGSMLDAWQTQTSSTFRSQTFNGDHFFPDPLRRQLVGAIVDDLGAKLG